MTFKSGTHYCSKVQEEAIIFKPNEHKPLKEEPSLDHDETNKENWIITKNSNQSTPWK